MQQTPPVGNQHWQATRMGRWATTTKTTTTPSHQHGRRPGHDIGTWHDTAPTSSTWTFPLQTSSYCPSRRKFALRPSSYGSSRRKFAPCTTGAPAQASHGRAKPLRHKCQAQENTRRIQTRKPNALLPCTEPWLTRATHALPNTSKPSPTQKRKQVRKERAQIHLSAHVLRCKPVRRNRQTHQ